MPATKIKIKTKTKIGPGPLGTSEQEDVRRQQLNRELQNDMQRFLAAQAKENPRLRRLRRRSVDDPKPASRDFAEPRTTRFTPNEDLEVERPTLSTMQSGVQKVLYILRGVPGSGKSTLAKSIAAREGGQIYSTDDFFIDDDGVYCFDASRIGDAHRWNQERAIVAMGRSVNPVIIALSFRTILTCDSSALNQHIRAADNSNWRLLSWFNDNKNNFEKWDSVTDATSAYQKWKSRAIKCLKAIGLLRLHPASQWSDSLRRFLEDLATMHNEVQQTRKASDLEALRLARGSLERANPSAMVWGNSLDRTPSPGPAANNHKWTDDSSDGTFVPDNASYSETDDEQDEMEMKKHLELNFLSTQGPSFVEDLLRPHKNSYQFNSVDVTEQFATLKQEAIKRASNCMLEWKSGDIQHILALGSILLIDPSLDQNTAGAKYYFQAAAVLRDPSSAAAKFFPDSSVRADGRDIDLLEDTVTESSIDRISRVFSKAIEIYKSQGKEPAISAMRTTHAKLLLRNPRPEEDIILFDIFSTLSVAMLSFSMGYIATDFSDYRQIYKFADD
ncbi:hypothetical protein HDU85_000768 [Gaertneriomyces sp. JEL0708]|nr:hypothetical protein HDU85_000768 [Gaertneriomyces sp. JEL0708]